MKPTSSDVLKGRGVPIQNHPGNRYLRKVVADRNPQYTLMSKSADKEAVAIQVLKAIQDQTPPGRFLEKKEDGSYSLIDQRAALAKIKQAFRDADKKRSTTTNEPKTKINSGGKATKLSGAKPNKSTSKQSKPSKRGTEGSSKGTISSGKNYENADMHAGPRSCESHFSLFFQIPKETNKQHNFNTNRPIRCKMDI
jgi:hypothetical protein